MAMIGDVAATMNLLADGQRPRWKDDFHVFVEGTGDSFEIRAIMGARSGGPRVVRPHDGLGAVTFLSRRYEGRGQK